MWKSVVRFALKLLGRERTVAKALSPLTKIVDELNTIVQENALAAEKKSIQAAELKNRAAQHQATVIDAQQQAKKVAETFNLAA